MKLLFLILGLMLPIAVEAATKVIDGKVVFPVATVNNIQVYSEEEKLALEAKFTALGGTVTVVTTPYVNDAKEVAISTNLVNISSYSDFQASLTKDGLFKRMKDLKLEMDLAIDLNDKPRAEMLKGRYNALKAEYSKLP